MALAHMGPIEFQTSKDTRTVAVNPAVYYDAYSDELVFKLDGDRQQSFVLPVNDWVSLLYDEETDQTIGIQIDDFTAYATRAFPELSVITRVVGIEPRDEGDTALYSENRIVRRQYAFTPEDELEFKRVIRSIIDITGGFDDDIVVEVVDE